jgi:GNAT superfamily N-acetyltransferase
MGMMTVRSSTSLKALGSKVSYVLSFEIGRKVINAITELEKQLLTWEFKYDRALDKSTDKARLAQYMKIAWFPYHKQLTSYWHLLDLAVHPKHQRHSIARKLVQQGLDMATKEQVPVGLESGVTGRSLYTQLGFTVIDRRTIQDDIVTLALVWEPDGTQGRWLDFKEDGSAVVRCDQAVSA